MDSWEATRTGPPGQAGGVNNLSIRMNQSGDEEAEELWTPDGEEVELGRSLAVPRRTPVGQCSPLWPRYQAAQSAMGRILGLPGKKLLQLVAAGLCMAWPLDKLPHKKRAAHC